MTSRSPAKPKSPERLAAEVMGRRGERLAAWYLRLKGYRIRAMRFKTPAGELDIVAERWGTVAFVEVKSRRRTDTEFDPLFAVDRKRILRAAKVYVSRHPALVTMTLRFDIILLAPRTWPRHLINAFGADG
jgi:putative endonuclease